jgi:hypothetical protein
MEKLVRQKIAEINANVGSKERTIATGDRWQWTVHHIHPRSFIYGAFCDGIVALLKKPDVLEYAFAVESKLMHRLDIVTLCIKVRFQE